MKESSKDNTRIWGIILAAGEGKRAGGGKLTRIVQGKPILQHVVEKAVKSSLDNVLLITGYEKNFGEMVAEHYDIKSHFNPNYSQGMSTSLKLGVSKIPQGISAILVFLGDMPYIQSETLETIINLHKTTKGKIIIPVYKGKKGHPVLISCIYKDEIYSISGDIGAREIIKKHIDEVTYVETSDPGIVQDIDY